MSPIRSRLIVCAIAVLACQAALASAAPIALCQGALSATDLDECCRKLAPGQTCPMHHTTHGARPQGPGWTCVCSPSDLIVASIVGVVGSLPRPIRIVDQEPPPAIITLASPATIDQQEPPQYPPPRA
jgi:hypothetical protein